MSDENILTHLKCPKDYDEEKWEEELAESLVFGCDWLAHFNELNPVPGIAVEDACDKLEEYRVLTKGFISEAEHYACYEYPACAYCPKDKYCDKKKLSSLVIKAKTIIHGKD